MRALHQPPAPRLALRKEESKTNNHARTTRLGTITLSVSATHCTHTWVYLGVVVGGHDSEADALKAQ